MYNYWDILNRTKSGTWFMPQISVIYLLILLILAGCGGGGDTSSGVENDDPIDSASFQTQALLGPVVDATVEIYDATDLTAGLLCSAMTTDSADLDRAGLINIPDSCVTEDGLYLLLVSGGTDIDADDDGVIDLSPTEVRGSFHALISGSQLRSGTAKATALTEAAYQHVRYLLATGSSQSDILQALDFSALRLLKRDLNGDGTIDHQDLAMWHPRLNRDSFRPSLDRLEELTNDIHVDSSTAIRSLRLHDAVSPQLNRIAGLTDADRVLINGSYLYVASSEGLHVADIGDPEAARIIANTTTVGLDSTSHMTIAGDRLYVERPSGTSMAIDVLAFDISNPANPVFLTDELFVPDGYDINKYLIAGNYAFVALHRIVNPDRLEDLYHEFRLDIVDLSVAGSPKSISSVALGSFCSELVIQGDRLYVGTEFGPYLESGTLSVFDITQMNAPRLINQSVVGSLEELTIVGDYAYGLTPSNDYGNATQVVAVFSLSRETGAQLIASLQTENAIWHKKQLLMQDGDRGYLATPDGVAVIDFTDRRWPTIVDQLTTNGETGGIALSASTLYAAVEGYGVQPYDLTGSSPTLSPAIINTIEIGGIDEFTQPNGNQVFAVSVLDSESSSRLFGLDLSDPQSPIISVTGLLPDIHHSLVLADNSLYTVSMFSGLNLFDVTNPSSIEFLSAYDITYAQMSSAFAVGDELGLLSGIPDTIGEVTNWYLLSLDLSQPTDPLVLNRTSLSTQPTHIAIDDDLVFVSAYLELVIYRMYDSGALSWQGALSFGPNSLPRKLIPKQDFAFLSYGTDLLGILDISNPSRPREISIIETPGQVADITLSGDLLFIACNAAGLQVVDVANPRSPRFVGNLPTQSPAESVMVVDDRVYVATKDNIVVTHLPLIDVP
jgi:hypothetical protein